MKRVGVFVALVLFLVFAGGVLAQDVFDDSGFEEEAEKIIEDIEEAKEFTEADKWEYLSEQWQEVLLENEGVARLDASMKRINPVFFFLLGENYSLSLTFLITLVIWASFFVVYREAVSLYGLFSGNVSWAIAFIVAVVTAHLRIYAVIAEGAFRLVFFNEGAWPWIFTLIVLFGWVILVTYLRGIFIAIRKRRQKKKEELAKKQQEVDREILHGTTSSILEGLRAGHREKRGR